MNDGFNNTNVLVIGGSYGIGRDIADVLANEHANVVILSRTPPLEKSLLNWRQLDLSFIDKGHEQLQKILDEFHGKLDAVFYSAVFYGPRHAPFLTTKEMDWKQQVNVNLYGLWVSLMLTLPILKRNAPSLFVHLSSEVMYNTRPYGVGYSATKAAACNLMYSLAGEDLEGNVRLIQLLPAIMVDSSDLNNRHPNNFNYSGSRLSSYIQQGSMRLLQTRGEGMHGKNLVFDKNGNFTVLN